MSTSVTDYKKLAIRKFPPRSIRETAEGRFWRGFKVSNSEQQVAAVSHVEYCPSAPFLLAATSSTRVRIYDGKSGALRKTIGRFKDVAYSGSFREDGKLVVAGGENCNVQVFDLSSRTVLRIFKGHTRPVHVTRYSPDRIHVISGSDDCTVRLWDVPGQSQAMVLKGHTDYIRCGAFSPASSTTWLTGSYDHTCRLWDLRTGQAIMSLAHAKPVDALEFLPSGSMVATSAGNDVFIWDVLSGGRLMQRVSNHLKTVTSLQVGHPALSYDGLDTVPGPRLLSASLDGHVKIFDLTHFKLTHAIKYPAPILSAKLSPQGTSLAVGMADGLLSVRHRPRKADGDATGAGGANSNSSNKFRISGSALAPGGRRRPRSRPRRLTASSYKYFIRGSGEKPAEGDYVVERRRRAHLAPYDRQLKKFLYRDALDSALTTGRVDVVITVMEELMARQGLTLALAGRDATSLEPLLDVLARYVTNPRYAELLVSVTDRVLDLYLAQLAQAPRIIQRLAIIREKVTAEVKLGEQLAALEGLIQPIIGAALARSAGAE
eukprot:jgi/Mesvir1/25637/Mv01855-RA.1